MHLAGNGHSAKGCLPTVILVLGLSACGVYPIQKINLPSSGNTLISTISTPAPSSGSTLTAQAGIDSVAFDIPRAMELLYGDEGTLETSPQGEVIVRIPPSPGSEDDQDQIIRILLTAAYREADEEMHVLITETGPEGTGAHAAMAQIGGAVFHVVDNTWQLEIEQRSITMMGSFGHAPAGDLMQIGPDRHGFLFEPDWMGQGNEAQYAVLIGIVGQTMKPIFNHEIFFHGETENTVWEYTSEMDFVPGGNPDYYDIHLTTQGTQPIQGTIVPFVNEEQFEFSGEEYIFKDPGAG